jgi:diaminopimelate epimerase
MGVGGDGLIFATTPEVEGFADIAARVLEPDGSEAELCGNGTGCFIHWVQANGWIETDVVKILTPAGVVTGTAVDDEYVRVCIPDPEDVATDVAVSVDGHEWRVDTVVTGVPHLIACVDDVGAVDMAHLGPALRHHEQFAPRGINANFVQVLSEGHIALRTFEFGVEGETLACGTGSASAAIVTARRLGWDRNILTGERPVLVRARSGDTLRVYFTAHEDGAVTDVCVETVVRFMYRGTLHPDLADRAINGAPGRDR